MKNKAYEKFWAANKVHYGRCASGELQPEKTAHISLRHRWFPREMTPEKRAKKFHTDDAQYPLLCTASDWLKICFIQSEAVPRFGL